MTLAEYAQHPIPDSRALQLELVESIAFQKHQVRRPQIAQDGPPMDLRETYPAEHATAHSKLRSQARRRPCALSFAARMTIEVKLFTKDARVELWAGLEGEETVKMATGELELEERVEGRGG